MTYEQIVEALRDRKCESTETALDYAVDAEVHALIEGTSKYVNIRRSADKRERARTDAQKFYAEDITHLLNNPVQPRPHQLLSLRRFAVSWAVAEVLRTNDDITNAGTKTV